MHSSRTSKHNPHSRARHDQVLSALHCLSRATDRYSRQLNQADGLTAPQLRVLQAIAAGKRRVWVYPTRDGEPTMVASPEPLQESCRRSFAPSHKQDPGRIPDSPEKMAAMMNLDNEPRSPDSIARLSPASQARPAE